MTAAARPVCTDPMTLLPLWVALAGLVLCGLVATGLAVGSARGSSLVVADDADAVLLLPWLAQERTRLLAAAFLGAISAAGGIGAFFRFSWPPGLYLAGSLGAIGALLALLALRAPEAGHAAPPPPRTGRSRRGFALVAALGLLGVGLVAGAASVASPVARGGWGLAYRQIDSISFQDGSGTPVVGYRDAALRPWLGWPDVALAVALVVVTLVLLALVLRRLAAEPTAAPALAEPLRDQRSRIAVGLVTGGLLAQVGMLAFGPGIQLAMLTDIDPTAVGGWAPTVAVQPHATIGSVAAVVGVVALVLAVIRLVLTGLALARLGVQRGLPVNSA